MEVPAPRNTATLVDDVAQVVPLDDGHRVVEVAQHSRGEEAAHTRAADDSALCFPRRWPPVRAYRTDILEVFSVKFTLSKRPSDRCDTQFAECGSREFGPHETEFLKLLFGATFHEQRQELPNPAALKLCVRMLHDGGNVVDRKGGVFFREATLHPIDQRPLFLRHPDIVVPGPMLVKRSLLTVCCGTGHKPSSVYPSGSRKKGRVASR